MKNNVNYIFKRVVTFFIIFMILSFVRSCNVKALSIENKGTSIRFMPNNTYANNLNWSQNYYNGTPYDNYNGFNVFAEVIPDENLQIVFDGRYLISFIVFSSQEQNGISCSNLSSNFRNVNITTGNWVSNEISSNCIDTYNTSYYNKPAIRILYEFTYKTKTGPTGITELNFIVNTNNNFFLGGDFGLDYGIAVSDIELYDINIINTWNNDKANQTIINQNNLLYGSLQQQIEQNHQIINNQNQNTQDIIDNQNQNTQDMIDNQNTNTEKEIESQMVCTKIVIDKNSIIQDNSSVSNNGSITSSNYAGVTDYIELTNVKKIKNIKTSGSEIQYYFCTYDNNKIKINCYGKNSYNNNSIDITDDEKYVRFTINYSTDRPQFEIEQCKNGNQALVDSLTDDSSPSLDALNNSAGWLPAGPVDSILNLPLSLFNNLTTNLSKSCQSVTLPIPLVNENIVLPCVNTLYEQMGISGWINTIGVIASALILFSYLAKLYKWVDDTLTFRENNNIDNWGGI